MKNDDKIFQKGNLTDFEKLLFAKSEIKKLSIEKGALESTIQELEEIINYGGREFLKKIRRENSTLKIENKRLVAKIAHLNKMLED